MDGAPVTIGSNVAVWSNIDDLQSAMERMEQADCPVTHRFFPGMYVREVLIRAGVLAVSKIHLTRHPFVVLTGKMLVVDQDGKGVVVEAPYFGTTEPGSRRVGLALEDVRWVTFHATDETDPATIEAQIIFKPEPPEAEPTVAVSQDKEPERL
jgi:hypothetical protein